MSAKKNSLFSNAIKKSAYDLMLDQEIDRMYKYGSQNQQNALNVANTVSGNTNYAPKAGAVGDIDRDVIKQAQIDRAVQTKALTAKGMFDQKHFALDDAYNHLSSLDYLRSLIPGLQQELENANQQDAEHKARNNYRVNNWQKWDDFNNTRDTMQEEEAWAYADYLLNGDTSSPFDMNAYNDAWNEMENDEFFAAQDALRKQYESVDWAKMTDKNATVEDQLYQEAAPGAQAKLDMTNKEIERRETIAALESEAMAAADFGSLSAFAEREVNYTGPNAPLYEAYVKGYSDQYNFINMDGTWADLKVAAEHSPTVQKYLDYGYDFLTPDEIAVYNYYYQRGDTDKAEQYLLALRSDLLYRRAMANQVYESTLSTNGWLAAPKFVDAAAQGIWNIASVPYQIYEAAVGIDDPYSAAFDALNKQGFIRGAQLGAIENADMPAVVKDVLQAVYQGAAGFSDNMARLIASGGNPTAVLIMAGLQSGSGSLQESASRDDMSGAAKIVKAIGAAAMEVGTEKIGLDALFDKGKAGALEYIKGVVLSELGEETINYVSQDALEAVVAFLFDHEAEIRSGDEFWQGLTDTWIQTALSSFMLGSVGSAQQGHQNKQYGSFVQQTADVDALLNLSEELGPQAKSYESGQALKARQAAGKKMKLGELGAFSRALADDIGEASSQVVKDITDKAIVGRLTELGTDEATAKKNAPAIRKLANGEKLTVAERAAVAWDDNATQVVTEMTRDIREGEENRAGNAWRNEYENELKTAQQKNLDKNLKYDRAMRPDKMTKAATAAADKKADELVKNAGNLKGKQFSATIEGRTVTGDVVRFEKGKAGLTAVLKNGDTEEKVNVADINGAADKGAAAVLSYIRDEDNKHYLMTPVEASEMMAVYNQVGGDVNAFVQDYQDVYLSGYAGIDMAPSTMTDGIARVVYGYGVENAKAAEADRASKAGKQGTRGTGKTSWIGKVTESAQVGTQASEETLEAAKERMKPSQRLTVDNASALAKRMNIDVVFFESDLSAGNAIENGSFISGTNTIYIDINSGANSTAAVEAQAKNGTLGYAVLKTMSHELTHYMEANSTEGYATYKQAIKDALKAKNVSWEKLVRSKIDNAIRAGQKLTLQGAEAEVIADASEYMLQDSKFVQDLDNSIKGKIKTFVQNFVAEVKQIFQRLMGGHVESEVLRDVFEGVVRYTGNLQKLWDAGMEDAIGTVGEATAEAVELSDVNTQYSIREEAPPKKTGIAYKVFFEKNGKLYPPMVANPGGADTPVGVWLNADVGTAAPPSKTGRLQVKAGGKGTQGGSGSLAFRPGWHLGDIPKASQFNRLNKATGVKELFPYNFVWAECEYAMDVDYQEEAMSYGYNASGKFQHSLAGLPRLPVDGYYHYRTNPDPTTVPWVITGAMKVNKILSRAEVDEILRENGVEPTKWQGPDGEQMEADGVVKQFSLRDSEYMEAVNSGDTAKAQQMVDEAAKRAGYTTKVYHGTQNFGFTVIDPKYADDKMSFFATDSLDVARTYSDVEGERAIGVTRPGDVEFDKVVKEYYSATTDYIGRANAIAGVHNAFAYDDPRLEEIIESATNGNADIARSDLEDYYISVEGEVVDWLADEDPDFVVEDYYESEEYKQWHELILPVFKAFDKAVALANENSPSGNYGLYANTDLMFEVDAKGSRWNQIKTGIPELGVETRTRSLARYAKERGYTGVKISNLMDDGGRSRHYQRKPATVYIFFYPQEQVKSADPVTYDDNGNVIPLSERFVSSNEDIRYSLREENNADFVSSAMKTVSQLESPDGGKLFSLRSMSEDYDTYREMLINAGATADEVSDLFHTIDETMQIVESHKDILDFGWNVGRDQRSFNPVKPNSDSLYEVSIDFSSLCRKRLLQQAVQERLEAKYNTVLTKAERVAIRNALVELQKEGKQIEVACALCYVESTRLKSPAQIQRFFDDRRKVLVDYMSKKNKTYKDLIDERADELITKFGYEPGTKINQLNSFQKKAVHDLKRSMYKTYKPTAEEEAIINTAMELPGEMFKSADGLWKLKRDHEVIFDAYTSFVRNATKSKGIETDEAWWAGDSKSISDGLISKMNAENGLRSQSWSDFQVIHLLDYMAAIIELSTRNAKMQTYTKVPDFVNLMGDTGIMINLSLIPQNFDGALNYDPVEGMPIETALMLREMFPNTAGTICIGITDDHIRLLLANGSIDYVIPYHKSSLDAKTRQQMGMKNWQDYELEQSEKNRDYPNTDKDSKNYRKVPRFSEWFNYDTVSARAQEVGAEQAMREAADSYIELCHKRGLQEKFVKFTPEANYWKLLIDRKMINQQTGEIINQQAVKPRFDLDRIKNILQGELDRFARQNSDFNSAIETIDRQWQNGDIRKAAKSKKVQDAVSAFDASVVVQNIVESAKELAEPAKQLSLRDTEDTVSVRDYLMEADESVANTIEEKNALSIYQERLRAHAEASDKVKEAEAALVGKTGDELKEAKGNLAAARARQNELFRRLTAVEKTHHVQSVLDRSEKFLREEITGKTESQIAEQIAQHEADIATLAAELQGLKGAARTQHEADIRSRERIVKQLRSDAARKMAAMNLRYQQAADEMRTRHDINAEINKKGAHIKKIVKNLNDRIIHEGDYKNVKQELKPVVHALVQEFIGGFGSLVFDQKKADSLLATYVKLAEDDAAPEFYSDDVELWLKELSDMAKEDERLRMEGGSSLSARAEKLAVYTKVSEVADHIYHLVKSADEVFVNGKRELFGRYAEEVGNELKGRDDSRLLVGVAGKAQKVFDDLIRRGNMIPQYFFESLKNNGLMRLYDSLQQGQREYAQNILAGRRAVTEAKAKYNYYTWSHKPQVFRTKQGHDIALTVEQKLWVYATAKRESSNELAQTHHLDQGGFRYDKNSLPKKNLFEAMPGADRKHLLSAADVENITSTLTAEQKAYADELVEFLSTDMAAIGNEASMNLFGIEKYNEKYYFPFKTDSGDRYQSSAAGSASTTNDARVKHSSFTHALRRKANTALVMGDFTNVVADHINLMSTYASFVVPIESLNRVLNRKVEDDGTEVSIRSLIGRKYGDAAQKYIADLLKDLNGGPQVDNRGSLSWMLRAFKRSAVMGSLSVAVQQPTAYLRAFAYIHPKYFAHLTMQGANETWEKMLKYSGTAVIKDMGRFDVGMGKAADDWIANDGMEGYNIAKRAKFLLDQKGFKAMSDNMVEALTALPGVMDRVTWTHLWKAIEAEQHDLHTEMNVNSASFLKMVGERFDDVVNHTQVYDSILSRSQNMRSKNALTQMSTAFMSESTLNANLYYSALRGGHGKAQAARMITAGIAANLAAAAFAAAVSAWRKEDDDRTALEKYLSAFASRAIDNLNPATMLPFVNDLWNIVSGYDVERTDWSVVADMAKYTETFFTKLTDSEKELKYTDIENFLGSLFNLAGIPYKNVSRDIRSAANFVTSNHSMPSSAGVKYSVIEEINPFWQSTNKAYCQRFVAALVDGDKQEAYDLWDYMTNTKGVSQGSLEDNVRAALKVAVQNGSLTVSQATELLRKYVPYKNDKDNINKPQEWLKTK